MKIGEAARTHKTWEKHMEATPDHRFHQHWVGRVTDITKDWVELEYADKVKLRFSPKSITRYRTSYVQLERQLARMRVRVSQLAAGSQVESLARSHRERGVHKNPFPDLHKKFQPEREKKYDKFLRRRDRHAQWDEPYFRFKIFVKTMYLTLDSIELLGRLYEDHWERRDQELTRDCLFELLIELLWEKDLFLDSELLRLIESKDLPALKKILGERDVFKKYAYHRP